jgi:hypothetical protein
VRWGRRSAFDPKWTFSDPRASLYDTFNLQPHQIRLRTSAISGPTLTRRWLPPAPLLDRRSGGPGWHPIENKLLTFARSRCEWFE